MMTHEDRVGLSQLIGAVKRAKSTVASSAGQILNIGRKYGGTTDEMLADAGFKCLFQAKYWLEQAVDTLNHAAGKSRPRKGGAE